MATHPSSPGLRPPALDLRDLSFEDSHEPQRSSWTPPPPSLDLRASRDSDYSETDPNAPEETAEAAVSNLEQTSPRLALRVSCQFVPSEVLCKSLPDVQIPKELAPLPSEVARRSLSSAQILKDVAVGKQISRVRCKAAVGQPSASSTCCAGSADLAAGKRPAYLAGVMSASQFVPSEVLCKTLPDVQIPKKLIAPKEGLSTPSQAEPVQRSRGPITRMCSWLSGLLKCWTPAPALTFADEGAEDNYDHISRCIERYSDDC